MCDGNDQTKQRWDKMRMLPSWVCRASFRGWFIKTDQSKWRCVWNFCKRKLQTRQDRLNLCSLIVLEDLIQYDYSLVMSGGHWRWWHDVNDGCCNQTVPSCVYVVRTSDQSASKIVVVEFFCLLPFRWHNNDRKFVFLTPSMVYLYLVFVCVCVSECECVTDQKLC